MKHLVTIRNTFQTKINHESKRHCNLYSKYKQSFVKIDTFECIVIFSAHQKHPKTIKYKLEKKYHLFLMLYHMIYSCIVATLSMVTLHTVMNSAMHGYILSMQKSYMISHNQDTNNEKYNANMINVMSFKVIRLKHDM